MYPCSYPQCSLSFSTLTEQRVHRLVSHPPRLTARDMLNMQKYVKRFQWTATGGKPYGQGPLSSYRTAWCGVSSSLATSSAPCKPVCMRCPHPSCAYCASSSSELIDHHYASHSDSSAGSSTESTATAVSVI